MHNTLVKKIYGQNDRKLQPKGFIGLLLEVELAI